MRRRATGRWAHFGWMLSGAILALVAYEAGKARADGPPEKEPLLYSGYLTDDEGTPVADGDRPMSVELFDADTAGKSLCRTPAAAGETQAHSVRGGHFSIPLDAGCVGAVQANSEVWVEVQIDGAKMPRTKIAAVPYALEANRARSLVPAGVVELEQALRTRECPLGFTRSPDDAEHVICERKAGAVVLDQVVLVGQGQTSFWVDRYEASVWDSPDEQGKSFDGDYPLTFPRNGQIANKQGLLFARSVPAVVPSSTITWFQANLACAASGKRLPTAREWHTAATGTGDLTGAPVSACNTGTGMKRATNGPAGCVSLWGAEDMIGNVGEMLADWQIGPNNGGLGPEQKNVAWGPEYGSAVTVGVSSYALPYMSVSVKLGLPSVEVRGGTFGVVNEPSLYGISMSFSPESTHPEVGFRCVIPR